VEAHLTEAAVTLPAPAQRGIVAAVRRTLDVVLALALLALFALPMLVIALAIRLDSPGPSLFRQERLGRGMRRFRCLKFRTMSAGCDAAPHREYVRGLICGADRPGEGGLYKLGADPRVTRVGRALRVTSLDELPQLLNVLRGEMALVGPRPVVPYEAQVYPPTYLPRFAVKPGITGLWQVSGRNERSYREMLALDLRYAADNSLHGDVAILVRTIVVVLGRRGVA
jgi:lipopolysaccharide/colanic/teichoic acid biosynthesis glycosyltransferase